MSLTSYRVKPLLKMVNRRSLWPPPLLRSDISSSAIPLKILMLLFSLPLSTGRTKENIIFAFEVSSKWLSAFFRYSITLVAGNVLRSLTPKWMMYTPTFSIDLTSHVVSVSTRVLARTSLGSSLFVNFTSSK